MSLVDLTRFPYVELTSILGTKQIMTRKAYAALPAAAVRGSLARGLTRRDVIGRSMRRPKAVRS
jgi:hypothetical protein